MSSLTASPSPAPSPRGAFYIRSPRPTTFAQPSRPSSATAASGSKRLSFSASNPNKQHSPGQAASTLSSPRHPAAPAAQATFAPSPKTSTQPSPQRQASRVGGAPYAFSGYVDHGTQYSPEAYPPTAPSQYRGSSLGKRKEAESAASMSAAVQSSQRSASAQDNSWSSANTTSTSSIASQRPQYQQQEQQQRRAPNVATASSSLSTSNSSSIVQEARSTHGHSAAPKRSRPAPANLKPMPRAYETCNPQDLGSLIANMLMELIRINDQIPLRDGRLTRFHSRAPPGISVADYLARLIQHATLSPPILLSMVFYIDRLCAEYPSFTVNSLTVHRFLITAATVAAKGLSDSFWTNPTYARIGGIPVSELATLELEFLQKVNWRIVPRPEMLVDYYVSLVDRTEGYILAAESGDVAQKEADEAGISPKNTREERDGSSSELDESGEDDSLDESESGRSGDAGGASAEASGSRNPGRAGGEDSQMAG